MKADPLLNWFIYCGSIVKRHLTIDALNTMLSDFSRTRPRWKMTKFIWHIKVELQVCSWAEAKMLMDFDCLGIYQATWKDQQHSTRVSHSGHISMPQRTSWKAMFKELREPAPKTQELKLKCHCWMPWLEWPMMAKATCKGKKGAKSLGN